MNIRTLAFAAGFAALGLSSTDAQAAILTVDCATGPYFTIQSAVVAAASGDTIVVHPCSPAYNENVFISAFDDLHLVGASASTPDVGAYKAGVGAAQNPAVVIDGSGLAGDCVAITGSTDVSVTGFKMQRCNNGVSVIQSERVVVHANRMQLNNFAGYFGAFNMGNQVTSNLIFKNAYGVYLENTSHVMVGDNRVRKHSANGMLLAGRRIQVTGNDITFSDFEGIHSVFGGEHRIERNTVLGNLLVGGAAEIFIDAGLVLVDAVGNMASGSILDLSASDLGDNL